MIGTSIVKELNDFDADINWKWTFETSTGIGVKHEFSRILAEPDNRTF